MLCSLKKMLQESDVFFCARMYYSRLACLLIPMSDPQITSGNAIIHVHRLH